ncbi:uncharacterized protein LOC119647992 isoform X2 [Hermetia illucens]|uniref:uncharacterized protein LOC119647992 isoform X2 n=1 Tax=Hermetia illucens TaxID=343691 RepID=UPI0018CC1089|nr:uncharacterized protein LOC119647992 isoform X2 [Hermetia illucens]
MEVMEEGNLMDRVPVLLQRDLQYYQEFQSVLQERLCPGVVGGKLDFPLYASFAAIKIVLWWEDEYFAAYKKYSGLLHHSQTSDKHPKKEDADSLHWENMQPFFESERGSYTIQMWWLYMKGTKQDLWNSVPPKMAQRVFSGMLNETLTVLTSRYIQTVPSPARSQLLLADICNILQCVSELLLFVTEKADDYIGMQQFNQSKIIRDIHAKCHELFCCLLLRGVPLGVLFKLLRKGTSAMDLFSPQQESPSPWIVFSLPELFTAQQTNCYSLQSSHYSANAAITLELKILLSAPQADWSFLLKVLLMRGASLSVIIMHNLLTNLPTPDNYKPPSEQPFSEKHSQPQCGGFLCAGECFNVDQMTKSDIDPVGQSNYQVVLALTYLIAACGKSSDMSATLISALDKNQTPHWADCLDKRQVWNQKRPPWLEAILHFVYPTLDCVVQMLINAAETGASMYQAMSLAITCLSEIWDCIPDGVQKIALLLEEIVPVSVKLLGDSVLMQILLSALYTRLLTAAENEADKNLSEEDPASRATLYYALAEAICSIDEDNKHTDQIVLLLKQIRESNWKYSFASSWLHDNSDMDAMDTIKIDDLEDGLQETSVFHLADDFDVESAEHIPQLLASDVLISNVGKQCLKILYTYLKKNQNWLLHQLGTTSEFHEVEFLPGQNIPNNDGSLLRTMFYIGHNSFDQLLTGGCKIDYLSWLQTPLSLTPERAWLQISQRSEFQEGSKLSIHETAMVAFITNIMKNN